MTYFTTVYDREFAKYAREGVNYNIDIFDASSKHFLNKYVKEFGYVRGFVFAKRKEYEIHDPKRPIEYTEMKIYVWNTTNIGLHRHVLGYLVEQSAVEYEDVSASFSLEYRKGVTKVHVRDGIGTQVEDFFFSKIAPPIQIDCNGFEYYYDEERNPKWKKYQ